MVPYDRDLADERRKYGEGMLRKGDEHLATQRQYETEVQAKLGAARQKRQEEKDRLKLEEVRIVFCIFWQRRTDAAGFTQDALLAGKRQAAEKLAEERRLAREQALEWTREVKQESDEEKEKKAKRASRKVNKVDGGASGDEGAPEPKKRRPRRKKVDAGDEDEEALFSANEEEGDSKPVKKASTVYRRRSSERLTLFSSVHPRSEWSEMRTTKRLLVLPGESKCESFATYLVKNPTHFLCSLVKARK